MVFFTPKLSPMCCVVMGVDEHRGSAQALVVKSNRDASCLQPDEWRVHRFKTGTQESNVLEALRFLIEFSIFETGCFQRVCEYMRDKLL